MARNVLFQRSYEGDFTYRNNFDWVADTGRYDWKGNFPFKENTVNLRIVVRTILSVADHVYKKN